MTYADIINSSASSSRPLISSYDLGYEYSQQHYIAVQCIVEDADGDPASFAHAPELQEVA